MIPIQLVNVSKTYPVGIAALQDVHLEVLPGEVFVLLGPSGCGKTTLLRLIAGLESPTRGTILLDGKDASAVPPHRRNVGLMFQHPAVYPHLSVRQNLVFPQRSAYNHDDRQEQGGLRLHPKDRVVEVAALLGLERLLDRKPFELSGGERQRIALGRLLLRQPAVFLLDEPLAHVDPLGKSRVRTQVRDWLRRMGRTVLWVTHDHAEALAVADRMAVMDAGRVLQVGPPREIYEVPNSVRVALLVGDPPMNLVPGSKVAPNGSEPAVLFGVRPQDAVVVPEGFVRLRLKALEYRETGWLARLDNGELSLTARWPDGLAGEVGQEFSVAWDWRSAHRFDAATGRRLAPSG
jgi:ABC-type sugar transport system ATPase subunit